MIRWISGKVRDKSLSHIVIDVSGIGYHIFCTLETIGKSTSLEIGSEIELWIHTSVKENAIDLYGFSEKRELEFFEMLLTISGIGPKTALGIMNTANLDTITDGVYSGDASYLAKISGLGRKTAEKIVIGLKEKIGLWGGKSGQDHTETDESKSHGMLAIDALISLGYSEREAREAIQKIDKNLSTEDQIKNALRNLNTK